MIGRTISCKGCKGKDNTIIVIKMKFVAILAILAVAYTLDNGLALTPPMVRCSSFD